MPYVSDAQRRYFNVNRYKLEAEGVDVDEWNKSTKGKKLPKHVKKSAEGPAVPSYQKITINGVDRTGDPTAAQQVPDAAVQRRERFRAAKAPGGLLGPDRTWISSNAEKYMPGSNGMVDNGPGVATTNTRDAGALARQQEMPNGRDAFSSSNRLDVGSLASKARNLWNNNKAISSLSSMPADPWATTMQAGQNPAGNHAATPSLTAGLPSKGLNPALLGALLGAGGGALAGAVRPGKRGRLRSMLIGGLAGGAAGGAAGLGYSKMGFSLVSVLPSAVGRATAAGMGYGDNADVGARAAQAGHVALPAGVAAQAQTAGLGSGVANAAESAGQSYGHFFRDNLSRAVSGLQSAHQQAGESVRRMLQPAIDRGMGTDSTGYDRVNEASALTRSGNVQRDLANSTSQLFGMQPARQTTLPTSLNQTPAEYALRGPEPLVPSRAGGGLDPRIIGALLGAGGGALAGAVRPGKRGRLQSMLLGGLAGGAVGGVAGHGYSKLGAETPALTYERRPKSQSV